MTITPAQLRYALLVAETGSFSETARRCNAAQPTVSGSISDLEAELGKPLFVRTTRRVELTAFGRALQPAIADAVLSIDRIAQEARSLIQPDRKLLRIAFTPLLDTRRIDALCVAYRRAHADVDIVFKECDRASLEERLDGEQVDVICGVNIEARPERARCLLYRDPLHYVLPQGDGELVASAVSLAEIAEQTLLLTSGVCGLAPATEALFKAEGVEIDLYPGRAMTHVALQEWAELGLGGAILPASRIRGKSAGYARVVAGGKPCALAYEAAWLKSSAASPHLKAFFLHLPKVAKAVAEQAAVWA